MTLSCKAMGVNSRGFAVKVTGIAEGIEIIVGNGFRARRSVCACSSSQGCEWSVIKAEIERIAAAMAADEPGREQSR